MDPLAKLFLITGGFGVVGSLVALLPVFFGRNNEDRLSVGNATGVGFLIGASIGAIVGIFNSLMGQF